MNISMQLDEGLMIMEEAIQKTKKIVEGFPETKFTSEEYMKYYAYPLSPSSCKPSCTHIKNILVYMRTCLVDIVLHAFLYRGLYNPKLLVEWWRFPSPFP